MNTITSSVYVIKTLRELCYDCIVQKTNLGTERDVGVGRMDNNENQGTYFEINFKN